MLMLMSDSVDGYHVISYATVIPRFRDSEFPRFRDSEIPNSELTNYAILTILYIYIYTIYIYYIYILYILYYIYYSIYYSIYYTIVTQKKPTHKTTFSKIFFVSY